MSLGEERGDEKRRVPKGRSRINILRARSVRSPDGLDDSDYGLDESGRERTHEAPAGPVSSDFLS